MSEIEQLRALLGKLPNPTEALELLDKVAAVPVAEPNMVWNADDLEEGGYSPDEFADYVAPSLGEESVFNVAVAISLPNRTMRVWREEDADGHHEVKWEWAGKASSADSIPRARLDELLSAEKRVRELEGQVRGMRELLGDAIDRANFSLPGWEKHVSALTDALATSKGGA